MDNLSEIAGHKQKRFTFDGRLVGDLGEVIAGHIFDVELTETQETGFDATISTGPNTGQEVEVKCGRKSTGIGFDPEPPSHRFQAEMGESGAPPPSSGKHLLKPDSLRTEGRGPCRDPVNPDDITVWLACKEAADLMGLPLPVHP